MMPYGVIDTEGKYILLLIHPPMFTFGIPLTSYITYRQIVGEIRKYSSYLKDDITVDLITHNSSISLFL
jgi:hypothetical protein